jgi:hypothetical protein
MSATFEITEVSAEEIKMGFVLNNTSLEYQGEFNYTEEETPEVSIVIFRCHLKR